MNSDPVTRFFVLTYCIIVPLMQYNSIQCTFRPVVYSVLLRASKFQTMEAAPQEPPEKLVAFDESRVHTRPGPRMAAQFPGPSATSTPMEKAQEQPKPRSSKQAPRVRHFFMLFVQMN